MDILASLSITNPICTSSIQHANVNQNNFFILPQQYQSLPPQQLHPQPVLPSTRYDYYKKPMKNMDPLAEIRNFKKEKEMLLSVFDRMDTESNGDIEFKEFKSGMDELNVSLTNKEIEQVFNCMDTDNSCYIDKMDFVTFLTQPWQSLQLQVLQDAIVSKVRGQKDKKGKLIKSMDENWSANDLYNEKKEMRQAMAMMINKATYTHTRSESKHQEHILYNEIEEKKDPDFGKIENCEKWTRFEVAMWLQNKLKLNQYTRKFVEYGIDGISLLNDLNRDNLMINLGVKRIHVEKLLREIRVLKDKITRKLVLDDDVSSVKFIDYAYYDDSPKLCQICMAKDKTHALTCGHLYCNDCVHQLRRCAYCNKRIDTIIKLFNLF